MDQRIHERVTDVVTSTVHVDVQVADLVQHTRFEHFHEDGARKISAGWHVWQSLEHKKGLGRVEHLRARQLLLDSPQL